MRTMRNSRIMVIAGIAAMMMGSDRCMGAVSPPRRTPDRVPDPTESRMPPSSFRHTDNWPPRPWNGNKAMERRRKQIEKGMIKTSSVKEQNNER